MNKKYDYDYLVDCLSRRGLSIITPKTEYINTKQKIIVTDGTYKALVTASNYTNEENHKTVEWFYCKNPFIIENINAYIKKYKNDDFECISTTEDCKTRDDLLKFRCNRCGEIIFKSLHNIRKDPEKRNILSCPNCDERFESLHAVVLKQIYKHYYPDTIEEERSCVNPNTNYVMPTDIVNHRLKIAIEIQGQWHKYPKQKERDLIKKNYWINRGYKYYDYEIDNVSVLEYVQYFFPHITEIPEWVDENYKNKLNIKHIQDLLNNGMKIVQIADCLDVNVHRIYDAIYNNKLHYPKDYSKSNRHKIIMLDKDKKYLKKYDSYADAERDNNIKTGLIASCVYTKTYYCKGYYWFPEEIYNTIDC